MPRNTTPSLRRHKPSQQGVVTLNGRDYYLGHWPRSTRMPPQHVQRGYDRLITEWLAGGRRLDRNDRDCLAIAELIERYIDHARGYYRQPDGSPGNELMQMIYSLRPVNHLYADMFASDYGPLALKATRQLMVDGYEHPSYGPQAKLSRGLINQRVKRIRRMFRWGVENQLVPAAVVQGLQCVEPLKRGRTEARESNGVQPVARAVVEETLPILRPMLRDMVVLQLETGMRPGELVKICPCDIDTAGKVWLYRPATHKTQHHGHQRIVPLGPKAQAIVAKYLVTDLKAHLFSPAKLMEERAAALRAKRQTKVQPSQANRRKSKPKKKPGDMYKTLAYGKAIAHAIKRHNRGKPHAEQIPHWHPHQLRHLRALELKRAAGLDVARAVLGHRSPVMTEHYATLDIEKGVEVMARIG